MIHASQTDYAVKAVVDPTVLPNAGLARPLTVTAPEGSVLNCVHPAAVDGRIAPSQRVCDIVMGALAQAVPGRVAAAGNGCCTGAIFTGTGADNAIWVYLETTAAAAARGPARTGCRGFTSTSPTPRACPSRRWSWISADAAALRADRRLGGLGPVPRRAGAPPGLPGRGALPAFDPRLARPFRALGPRRRRSASGTRLDLGDGRTRFEGMLELVAGQVVTIETPGGGGHGPVAERSGEALAITEGRIDAATHRRLATTQNETA